MTTRTRRLLWGAVIVPASALAGFLLGGHLAALLAGSGSALADAATVALSGLIAALLGVGIAIRLVLRQPESRLPVIATALVVAALVGLMLSRREADRRQRARDEVPTESTPPAASAVPAPPAPDAPEPGDSLVGLLEFRGASAAGDFVTPLTLRAAPRPDAPVRFVVQRLAELDIEEIGYEEPAVVVRGTQPGWLRLALPDGGSGWVESPAGSRYTPLADLVVNRLNYLTLAWDRRVAEAPGVAWRGVEGIDPGEPETPAVVHGSRIEAGTLWLEVSVQAYSPCEGDGAPPDVARGWVPAWTAGEPTAWFHSRGC
ncbi:MAG TPA: hypothetical protein PLI93_05825 [Gemmatimonadales bacterium]|nr:hypothetical protein [Gemmatimonadales bacterium]HRX19197.1 hypothetical protein [Gemmatimonadales bacterium]